MSDEPKIALGKMEWGVIISLLFSGGTTLFTAGILYGDVQNHERRLVVVESKSEGVSERLSNIEGKLDFLVDQYKNERRNGR